MCLGTQRKGGAVGAAESVGQTPTDAVEKSEQQQAGPHACGLTALPGKSQMIAAGLELCCPGLTMAAGSA